MYVLFHNALHMHRHRHAAAPTRPLLSLSFFYSTVRACTCARAGRGVCVMSHYVGAEEGVSKGGGCVTVGLEGESGGEGGTGKVIEGLLKGV